MKPIVNIAVGTLVLCASFFIGYHSHSAITGLLAAAFLYIVQIQIDIRLNLRKRAVRTDPLIAKYKKLRKGDCELFKELAETKYRDTDRSLEELLRGQATLRSEAERYAVLRLLFFGTPEINEIHATSYGELDEWEEEKSAWAKNYSDLQKDAVASGKKLYRTFILDGGGQRYEEVFARQRDFGIIPRIALKSQISGSDFQQVNNCMIFFDGDGIAKYCFRAIHDAGQFSETILYSDSAAIKPYADAYDRVNNIAKVVSVPEKRSPDRT